MYIRNFSQGFYFRKTKFLENKNPRKMAKSLCRLMM